VRRHAKASFAGSTLGSGARRARFGLVSLCILGLAAFLGSGASSASAQACPNEELRVGPSANLPDCRAYELVSPPEKEGQQVAGLEPLGGIFFNPLTNLNGQVAAYNTFGAFGKEAPSGGLLSTYLARRGASDWSNEEISTPLEPYPFLITSGYYGFTEEDFGKAVTFGPELPPLTPGASEGTTNLYLRDNATGSYRLVSVGAPPDLEEVFWEIGGISVDASHLVFISPGFELTSDSATAASPYLYDWSAATGALTLVGRLPNNSVSTNTVSIAGRYWRHPVSADGSRIFFSTKNPVKNKEEVYVRINETTTQEVSKSQKTVPDPTPQAAKFWAASEDGSLAYFTSKEKLTNDATTGPTDGGEDLYRYDVDSEELTDLTPDPGEEASNGARVQGVLGSSSVGSRLYFVAQGILAPGATAGQNNLYMWSEGGGIEFIATGNTSNIFKNNYRTTTPTSRVTPDGMYLAFTANNSLTGYPDAGHSEVYLYSAATGELACASCNPSGEPATSNATIEGSDQEEMERLSRNLSNNGAHLFFTTGEALVPRDSNNKEDIYEYDAAGGEVGLISTGTGGEDLLFDDASTSGNDAFLVTKQRLVGIDQDEAADLYDVRVGGGLASQNPPPATPPCTGTGCLGENSTPSLAGAGSATVVGKGNLSSKQNCNKLGKEAKKLSNRAKRLRKHANKAKKAGKTKSAKQLNKKANRLAKQARNKSKSAKKCRKRNRGASK
jgi:hypothetical protein